MAQKARQEATVERLPNNAARAGARRYIEDGVPPGGFVKKVLKNDFVGAVLRADDTNRKHLYEWAMWAHNDIPKGAWGDAESYKAWIESGGLNG